MAIKTIKNERKIIDLVLDQYALPIDGYHGIAHWARVYEIGQRVATLVNQLLPKANLDHRVPALFALLHDACRLNEGHDPDHGPRAAVFAEKLYRDGIIDLPPELWMWVYQAIESHTHGVISAYPYVQVCYDSDRLDLPRVGIYPDSRFISYETYHHRELMKWSFANAVEQSIPLRVLEAWGCKLAHIAIANRSPKPLRSRQENESHGMV